MTSAASSQVGEITRLLNLLADEEAPDRTRVLDRLVPLVYAELKALAHSNRYRWSGGESPGTTSLVHEAYARLAVHTGHRYESRRQFFCVASKAMRSILVDNARSHRRQKRGGGARRVSLEDAKLVSEARSEELLALEEALRRLEEQEPELARIVECRCFGGLTIDETAEAIDASPATVKRRWRLAQAWLYRQLRALPGFEGA